MEFETLDQHLADLEGGRQAQQARPPKIWSTMFLFCFGVKSNFVSECLENKAQIARENIKKKPPESFKGPLASSSGPRPYIRDFGLRACDVGART